MWGEIISIKNTTILISFALVLIFIIGAVSAADVNGTADDFNDASVGNVSDGGSSGDLENETEVIQNATFSKVSKSNYLIGDSMEVKILDENGTGIANKSVYFTVNGAISKVKTDDDGVAKFLLKFKKGTYAINFKFNETGYNPIKGSKKILLLSKPVSTIKGSSMKAYAGIKKTFKVTLKADGMTISGRKVVFTITKKNFKKTYTRTTNSKGIASFVIYLSKGNYKVAYKYAGEDNIKSSKSSNKVSVKLLKNPYKTKYRKVIIDADGGFTKAFLNELAGKLRKAGWKVVVKGIGPDQHSKNYKLAKNCVYLPLYNGMCAGTIKEMAYSYYGGLIKKNKAVLAPAWYTANWTNPHGMLPYRYDISKIKFLKPAWDDNFSPSSFKGLSYPANYMTKNGIKYCVGDTAYMIAEQFLYGGWVAHH